MDLSVAQVPTARALRLDGELDLATVDRLTAPLAEAVAAGGPIVVDMTSLSFMDSIGISALAKAALELEKNGWCLYLHTDDGIVAKALRIVHLDTTPNVHIFDHPGAHTPAIPEGFLGVPRG